MDDFDYHYFEDEYDVNEFLKKAPDNGYVREIISVTFNSCKQCYVVFFKKKKV